MPRAGSWSVLGVRLPEFGITEKIADLTGKPRTVQGGSNIFGSNLKSSAQSLPVKSTLGAKTVAPQPVASSGYSTSGGGTYSQQPSGEFTAPTSGESVSGGGGESDGGGYDYIAALRDSFNKSRSALEGILPTYDSDYTNFKSDTEAGIQRAKDTLSTQNAEDERLYGTDLRKLLQSDKELRQRRQGLFSANNALDSSQYINDTIEADQRLLEDSQGLDAEKRRNYDARQKEYSAYEREATSKLAQYGNEITRAKQALQQSIASVNMDEAASIQSYIDKLMSEAQKINAQREAMALNLTQLQAQGTDVVGNLSKLNMGAFSNIFGQNLAKRIQAQLARYAPGGGGLAGAGYIGSSSNDELKRLYGI